MLQYKKNPRKTRWTSYYGKEWSLLEKKRFLKTFLFYILSEGHAIYARMPLLVTKKKEFYRLQF